MSFQTTKLDCCQNNIINYNNNNTSKTPTTLDVLFGRGKPFQRHPGNIRMLTIVQRNRSRYQNAINSNKSKIVLEVIEEIKTYYPPVRFLKRLYWTDKKKYKNVFIQPYDEATEDEVYTKIAHSLRTKQRQHIKITKKNLCHNVCTKQPMKSLNQIEENRRQPQLNMPINQIQLMHEIRQDEVRIQPTSVTTELRVPIQTAPPSDGYATKSINSSSKNIVNGYIQNASINTLYSNKSTEDNCTKKLNDDIVQIFNVDTKYPDDDNNGNNDYKTSTSFVHSLKNVNPIVKPNNNAKRNDQKKPNTEYNNNGDNFDAFCSNLYLPNSNDSMLQSSIIVNNSIEQQQRQQQHHHHHHQVDSKMEMNTSKHVTSFIAANVEYNNNNNITTTTNSTNNHNMIQNETKVLTSSETTTEDSLRDILNPLPILESKVTTAENTQFTLSVMDSIFSTDNI